MSVGEIQVTRSGGPVLHQFHSVMQVTEVSDCDCEAGPEAG